MKIAVNAYHIGDLISITAAMKELDFEVAKCESSYALFELDKHSWVYVKDYGSVVFINCEQEESFNVLRILIGAKFQIDDLPQEEYSIVVKESAPFKVGFSTITVPELDCDTAHVIALNIGQTVALEDFQLQVNDLLELTRGFSKQLVGKGVLSISRKEVRQIIGQTMVLKNKVAENLFVFETPDVAWSEQHLATIDKQLRQELEIQKRHQGLQLNLSVVKENLDLYQTILQHRHSSILEWIIILLILFEVIQVFIP